MITSARRRAPPCPRTWHSVRTCKCAEYSVHRVQPCKLLLPHYCPPSLGIIRPFDYTWCELLIGNDPTRRVEFSIRQSRGSQITNLFVHIALPEAHRVLALNYIQRLRNLVFGYYSRHAHTMLIISRAAVMFDVHKLAVNLYFVFVD